MSVINSIPLIAAGDDGYQISRSVRLRSSASAYLNRTLSTPTSNQKMTLSCWVKIGSTSQTAGQVTLLNGGDGTQANATNSFIQLRSDGTALKLAILCNSGGAATVGGYRTFAPYLRDNSAWYHIVLAADTTQASAANRYRGYINGVEITSYIGTDPNQNVNITWLNTAVGHLIGRNNEGGGPVYGDTYITEMYWIDGQQLTPSSFGETNAITGVWQPKKYAGTYGTNGFYLNFSDNSAATATTIGKDYSGNGNNWTPNNISVTAGVTYDSMLDVPTPYADGGNGRGNYAVMNPIDLGYNAATSEANLKVSTASAGNATSASTMALSTNTYWEVTIGSNSQVGLIWGRASDAYGNSSISMFASGGTGSLGNATRTLSATPSWSNGDTLGFAWNNSTRVLTLYQAGSATAVMTMTTPATGDPNVAITNYTSGAVMSSQVNFGQRPFTYTPPTGFVALNTQNLPAPTISNGASYMAATTYTGNGTSQSISNAVNGVSFQPDMAWVKDRSAARSHILIDAVRGTGLTLFPNETTADQSNTDRITSFNSNGFSVGTGLGTNANTETYVGWQWNASGSTVTNTSGSISAQVRANPTAGFSVCTFNVGASGAKTFGHGLGVAPKMVIVKSRTSALGWCTYHASATTTTSQYLQINLTSAVLSVAGIWGSTLPTSTLVGIGSGTNVNVNDDCVAYCFAEVAGYSAFGSYTGNGSTDGPFVYTGFRPRFVMWKNASAVGDWQIFDTSRNLYNLTNLDLRPNLSQAETTQATTNQPLDFLSNGFKIRGSGTGGNGSGNTIIYAAFAENPFKLSLAR